MTARNKKILIISLTIFLSALLWALQTVYIPKNFFSKKEVVFIIEKGESSRDIAYNLEKRRLIQWTPTFRAYAHLKGVAKNLQAGSYLLSPSMNVPQIVEKFSKGEVVGYNITIIEGWDLRDIGLYLENKGIFQSQEFFKLAGFPNTDYSKSKDLPKPKDFSSEYDFLNDKSERVGLEGYLFPDTYKLDYGASVEDLILKALDNFGKKLDKGLRDEIQNQEKTFFEIITMASMLEREVKTKEDKEIVSGILWKRLKAGIPLQVDATLSYITGKDSLKFSSQDTKIDSPFNTYKYQGLPLGPISNPGLESIKAAIYSKESKYWYYLSTPEGETIFSETLKEHTAAKNKYLK